MVVKNGQTIVTTATVIRETGKEVFNVSSGQKTDHTETWWWNEEVAESIGEEVRK